MHNEQRMPDESLKRRAPIGVLGLAASSAGTIGIAGVLNPSLLVFGQSPDAVAIFVLGVGLLAFSGLNKVLNK